MAGVLRFVAGRIALMILQAFLIATLVFFLMRLLPGDPSYALAGPNPTPGRIAVIHRELALDQPLPNQFLAYLVNLVHGNWGRSITTSSNVINDLGTRFPATFELITASLLVTTLVTIPWAAWSAMRPRHLLARVGWAYSRLAGAVPEFWLAILLVFVFYSWARIAPAPIGRLEIVDIPPHQITGMYTVDSLLAGRLDLFVSALGHMVLPAIALALVASGIFYRQTRVGMERELRTTRVLFSRACGLTERQILTGALRNILQPVLAVVGTSYAYLISGAVLIESVFSWGGLGQYAVQAIQSSDYFAISGVVLSTSFFTLLIYLLVDAVSAMLDPRVRAG